MAKFLPNFTTTTNRGGEGPHPEQFSTATGYKSTQRMNLINKIEENKSNDLAFDNDGMAGLEAKTNNNDDGDNPYHDDDDENPYLQEAKKQEEERQAQIPAASQAAVVNTAKSEAQEVPQQPSAGGPPLDGL